MSAHSSKSVILILLVSLLAIAVGSAQGALLGLNVEHYPRLAATTLTVDYYGAGHANNDSDNLPNGSSAIHGYLHMSANSMYYYETDGDNFVLVNGNFDVKVAVDPSTGAGVGGTLEVDGLEFNWTTFVYDMVVNGMDDADMFYSTDLTAFGWGAVDMFEAKFKQEGSGMVAPNGETIGIIVDARAISEFSGADPYFTSPDARLDSEFEWHNTGISGNSDTFFLPEPATLIVLAMAGGLAVTRRRRPR